MLVKKEDLFNLKNLLKGIDQCYLIIDNIGNLSIEYKDDIRTITKKNVISNLFTDPKILNTVLEVHGSILSDVISSICTEDMINLELNSSSEKILLTTNIALVFSNSKSNVEYSCTASANRESKVEYEQYMVFNKFKKPDGIPYSLDEIGSFSLLNKVESYKMDGDTAIENIKYSIVADISSAGIMFNREIFNDNLIFISKKTLISLVKLISITNNENIKLEVSPGLQLVRVITDDASISWREKLPDSSLKDKVIQNIRAYLDKEYDKKFNLEKETVSELIRLSNFRSNVKATIHLKKEATDNSINIYVNSNKVITKTTLSSNMDIFINIKLKAELIKEIKEGEVEIRMFNNSIMVNTIDKIIIIAI